MATQSPTENELLDFDRDVFPFRRWFLDVLDVQELENLHRVRNVTTENFARNVHEAQIICENRISEIYGLLEDFVRAIIEPRFGTVLSWQQVPTVRMHFAVHDPELEQERQDLTFLGYAAFLKKHYFASYRPAMFHRDKDYGLPPGSVNAWIPVTDVEGANSLWIGGTQLRGCDALPVKVKHGQCLCFDGANRWHGAVWNTSSTTRVSFDLRFFPARALELLGT